jgi:hypothetical protein
MAHCPGAGATDKIATRRLTRRFAASHAGEPRRPRRMPKVLVNVGSIVLVQGSGRVVGTPADLRIQRLLVQEAG